MVICFFMSKLQVLSFMYVPNCRRYPLTSKLTGFVINVSESCMFCPLTLTLSDFLVNMVMWDSCHFISLGIIL
ncbi:hypothetical protein Hanom_Chr07g00624491 [Helianthus anomalus]